MLRSLILTALLAQSAPAFAGAVIQGDSLLLTGSHAATVRALLARSTPRTRNYITVVGDLSFEGENIRLQGQNLGELSGLGDAKLNDVGNAFGSDSAGTVYLRGVLPAYLIDLRSPRFSCQNSVTPGGGEATSTESSACALR